MKIKDIVNRDNVTLTNCDHEPIHIPGSIQPHGFLIAYKTDTLQVDFCSGNTFDYTGWRHEQILGKNLTEIFGASSQEIADYKRTRSDNFASPMIVEIAGRKFGMSLQSTPEITILEFEPAGVDVTAQPDFYYEQTRQFVSYMENASSLQSLCQRVAEQTRAITGYDRVMIYRFDADYNGEVYGESKRNDLEPFLGLHYPHTDIPAQARELYKQNLLRLIVDIKYKPVPLYTIDDAPGKTLNLGNSTLRSVSPIHIQYLTNIGVGGTLTISLMHENRLWGLIACHHYSPKYIDKLTRNAAQLQGHFITSQINVRQLAEKHDLARDISDALKNALNRPFILNRNAFQDMVRQPEILKLCNAAGVAIFIGDQLYVNGNVPKAKDLQVLLAFLKLTYPGGSVQTHNLSNIYNHGEQLRDCAAGVVWYCLDAASNIGIIWLRGETISEVHWGGDPNKAIIKDEKGLSPRKSFELWKEEVRLQSKRWTEPELSSASSFAHSLERQAHLLFISEEEIKYRNLSKILKETNDELENINWISTHDLKEPLRKIRMFGSRILDEHRKELNSSVINSIEKMNNSAGRMQRLISDLMTYSQIRQNSNLLARIELSALVDTISEQFREENPEITFTIETPLPAVNGISVLLQQLFVNLVSNSVKFKTVDIAPHITIGASSELPPINIGQSGLEYTAIFIRDNGIGFEQEYHDLIFNIFARLHSQNEFTGSGVGLALCKKIMQLHNGLIKADSSPGKGAQFTLFFPKIQVPVIDSRELKIDHREFSPTISEFSSGM